MVGEFGITEEELAEALSHIFRLQSRGWITHLRRNYLNERTVTRLMTTSMMMVLQSTRDADHRFSIETFAEWEGLSPSELILMMGEFIHQLQPELKSETLSEDSFSIVEDLRQRTGPARELRERIRRWLDEVDTPTEDDAREQIETARDLDQPRPMLAAVL